MKKGSKRELNRVGTCRFCGELFACADPKSSRCPDCRAQGCQGCGRPGSRCCMKCRWANRTEKQAAALAGLHEFITGDNNPSKRPEVRKKLSDGKKGDLNPARIHRAQFAAHIARFRPGRVSKLEALAAEHLQGYTRQYALGTYRIDFADAGAKVAFEIQGRWFHSCQRCFPNSPSSSTQDRNFANDQRKRAALSAAGWALIEVWEHDLRSKGPAERAALFRPPRTSS